MNQQELKDQYADKNSFYKKCHGCVFFIKAGKKFRGRIINDPACSNFLTDGKKCIERC